jgi:hypothetical protein
MQITSLVALAPCLSLVLADTTTLTQTLTQTLTITQVRLSRHE